MGRQAGLTGLLLPEFERESSRQTCTIAVADMTAVIDHFFAEGVISEAGNSQLSLRDGLIIPISCRTVNFYSRISPKVLHLIAEG